ncbi:MAG: hypothetical protein SFU99_19840 [Saprospiraceae bacterium]|nr:hypothetical protein [Saprospiraceae bacterium]
MPEFDALHELVHSLDQSEKRHFKIFAKRHITNGESQYLRLFDILNNLEIYNETTVKKQLGKSKFAKNLSSGKNYLYNLVLRSLRSYNNGRSLRTSLHELWLDINILMEKGLLKQAAKLIRKAKKLAGSHHYDIQMLEILLMERKLIRRYTSNHANELIRDCQDISTELIDRIRYRLKMLDLYENLFLNHRDQNEARQSLSETVILAEQLVAEQPQHTGFEVMLYYHILCFNYAKLARDYTQANQHLRSLIALYEEHTFMIDEDQEGYINILNNYLNNCFILNRIDEFPPILNKMRHTEAQNFKIKALIFQSVYYLEVVYHLSRKAYKEVINIVPDIKIGLSTYGSNITKSRELAIIYNVAIAYFLEKDYPKALDWINRILNEPKLEERQDIQDLARIFQIVLHYELGNQDFTESLILSANRYLRKKEKHRSAEFIIANHLKQALFSDPKKEKVIFSKLETELKNVNGLEEIKIWIASKI